MWGNLQGAGRKVGTGKFGESTEVMRVPSSQKAVISDFLQAYQRKKQFEINSQKNREL